MGCLQDVYAHTSGGGSVALMCNSTGGLCWGKWNKNLSRRGRQRHPNRHQLPTCTSKKVIVDTRNVYEALLLLNIHPIRASNIPVWAEKKE